ncbi:thioredoxin [Brevibacterium samyangense]|uniref:Thioredoxin n=1 Tax=Brevibacterium samyangense TaxID=366888 RepID=A0ABN2T462_9MICO
MTKEVTDASFDVDVLSSDKPVLVDFWAPWCGPCRMVSPIVDEIGEEYAEKLSVVKINTDENLATASKYGITSIPALYVFKDGEVAKTIIGARPKPALLQELSDFVA